MVSAASSWAGLQVSGAEHGEHVRITGFNGDSVTSAA